ncbi:MAG: multicopper oxidase domain-containing protein [Deltaproteobacteria bacterium]|nr:multicopper oxidase domain-containing protein [Deltaproteobacteria bacterium]
MKSGKSTTIAWGLALAALAFWLTGMGTAYAAPLPGGTLDPLTIPKYVTPLVIPPVMKNDGASNSYDIAVRQFKQQILPGGFPATTVWSYGPAADPVPLTAAPDPASQFNYPAYTIETTSGTPVSVRWINDLVAIDPATGLPATPRTFLPHLLGPVVDQTLHWANPPGPVDSMTMNPAPYTGPVPIVTHVHGAEVAGHSDGYPEAWWLPAASDIPAGYFTQGTLFDDSTGTNPGNLGYADYYYINNQPATTLWYHDHTLGMTRLNVYAGPAGFWLIRGGAFDGATDGAGGGAAVLPGPAPVAGQGVLALNVPTDPIRQSIREIPIVIQDRSFNADGSLFYPASRTFFDGYAGPYVGDPLTPTDIAPIWNPEAFFNTMVVNGVTWPVLEVAPAKYRFRLLNGCNSRFLNLALFEVVKDTAKGKKQKNNAKFGAELPFYQIGAEQGFLPQVVQISTGFATPLPGNGTIPAPVAAADPQQALLMGLAERADVIVDFSNLPNGTRIRMINTAPDAPFGGFPDVPADPSTTGQVMEFVVNTALLNAPGSTDATATPPQNLVLNAEGQLGGSTVTRQVSLNEEMSGQVCVKVTPSGQIKVVQVLPPPPLTEAQITAACAALNAVPMGPKAALLGTVDFTNPAAPLGVPLKWMDETGVSTPVSVTMADGVTVNMVNVTENPTAGDIETWEIYNFTVDAHPIHLHLVRFEVVSRAPIPGVVPAPPAAPVQPWETGFKDTVIAYPGQITRVKAQFPMAGLYVWHCHIVEHEDNEMMRPYVVSAAAP